MPHYLVKLGEDQYVDWSTIVDAPVSNVMTRDEILLAQVKGLFRSDPMSAEEAEERLARTDENGHSALWFGPETVEELIACNHAGPNGTEISLEEILKEYKDDHL